VIGIAGIEGSVGRALGSLCVQRAEAAVALGRVEPAIRGLPARPFRLDDRATWSAALDGVDRLFLPIAAGEPDEAAEPIAFLEEAQRVGVAHVVCCSARAMVFAGRALAWHRVESWLAQSGPPHTILRPSWLMQSFGGAWRGAIGRGVLALPTGGGRCTFVDAADVAEAALVAGGDRWAGKVLTLCGPEPLSVGEALERVGQVSGLACAYAPVTAARWERTAVEGGMAPAEARLQCFLLQLLAADTERHRLPDLDRVLGRGAGSFEQFLRRDMGR